MSSVTQKAHKKQGRLKKIQKFGILHHPRGGISETETELDWETGALFVTMLQFTIFSIFSVCLFVISLAITFLLSSSDFILFVSQTETY